MQNYFVHALLQSILWDKTFIYCKNAPNGRFGDKHTLLKHKGIRQGFLIPSHKLQIDNKGGTMPLLCSIFDLVYEDGIKSNACANLHRYCKWKDRIHVLCVFSFLTPFIRCINYTCRHNISHAIYFDNNPTHKGLGKTGGRSVENANEIRIDIKTHTLLSRSSTDIYAGISTVYGSNLMSFSSLCRWVMKFSADVGPVIRTLKSGISKSKSSLKIVEYLFSKIRRKIYFSADCEHVWNFKSIFIMLLAKYFETEEEKH